MKTDELIASESHFQWNVRENTLIMAVNIFSGQAPVLHQRRSQTAFLHPKFWVSMAVGQWQGQALSLIVKKTKNACRNCQLFLSLILKYWLYVGILGFVTNVFLYLFLLLFDLFVWACLPLCAYVNIGWWTAIESPQLNLKTLSFQVAHQLARFDENVSWKIMRVCQENPRELN